MGVAAPVPIVIVKPLLMVALPSVICPVDAPPTVELAVTVTAVVPRLITPVPKAEIVPAIDLLLGAVAITPAVNWVLSPAASPNVSVPVFLNSTAELGVAPAAIVFAAPVIDTL